MTDNAAAPAAILDQALRRVGDRWCLLVIAALLSGPGRFGDLERVVPGIATNVLSQRLKHLEAERLVLAVRYRERPARYCYELTEAGRGLAGVLRLLTQWSGENVGGDGYVAADSHDVCGTPLETAWWCPTCERRVDSATEEVSEQSRWL